MTTFGWQGPESRGQKGPGTQEGLPLYLLMRRHLLWPFWLWGILCGTAFLPQGPTHLLPPQNEAHLAWPFIPAWAQGWLTLSPSPLPGSAKSSPPCYWKGFQELEARFTQRVHHGKRGGMVWGSASQQGALTREGGGDGGAENPTVGCA